MATAFSWVCGVPCPECLYHAEHPQGSVGRPAVPGLNFLPPQSSPPAPTLVHLHSFVEKFLLRVSVRWLCVQCGEDPEAEEQAAAPATARRVFFVCTPDNHIWCISEVVRCPCCPVHAPHACRAPCHPQN